MVFFQNELEL